MEWALFILMVFGILAAGTALESLIPIERCMHCGRMLRSASPDGCCWACRDPELRYLLLTHR